MNDASLPPSNGEAVAPVSGAVSEYPVRVELERSEEYSRFMPLIKWLIVLPHYVCLFFLGIGAMFAMIGAFFVVLFTGRYPEGIFKYMVGVMRWQLRVQAYVLLAADTYPPFTMDPDPSYPASFEVDYPADGVARWRPFFAWLVAIPYVIVATLLFYVAAFIHVIAFFTILFTRSYPEGMFNVVENAMRWMHRGSAYGYYLSTEYPPFEWES